MADDLNDMIQGFVEESHEAFDDIENDLLTIESNPEDLSIVNGIFRVMHTIKGTAGFLNLDEIGKLAHKIESIFDMIRREELKITSEIMDTLLPAIDLLKLMVFELIEEKKSEYHLQETLRSLHQLTRKGVKEETADTESSAEEQPEEDLEEKRIKKRTSRKPDTYLLAFRGILKSISPQLKSDFVVESEEHIETIEENLLILEQNPQNKSSINEVFRAIHSIKGTSDYVNLETITQISHKLETIFDRIRKGTLEYDNELADVVLKGVDILRTLIFMLKTDDTTTVIGIGETMQLLEEFVEKLKGEQPKRTAEEPTVSGKLPKADKSTETSSDAINAFKNLSSQQMLVIRHLGATFLEDSLEPEELMVLLRSVKTLRDGATSLGIHSVVALTSRIENLISAVVEEKATLEEIRDDFQKAGSELITELNIISESSEKDLQEAIQARENDEGSSVTVTQQLLEKQKPVREQQAEPQIIKDSTIKTMRVDSTRLDTFMNLIGELIITRNSYSHTISELTEQKVPNELLQELKAMEANFNRISEDLQATLMEIRLLPVKSVFQKIPRIIRDISRKKEKQISFQMIGENTEIDKSIIEMIGDPLVHIVRNCCDHGIETVEERKKAGKPEVGSIILRASHLGSAIAIDVIDDGAGIDTDRVKQLAVEKGMVTKEKADTLDAKAVNSFIFQPGFSTAGQITDISGRGVGMDVVVTNIKKIHGTVDIDSERGHGTQVRLMLPLTLAVVDALLVIDNQQKYAIPLEAVKETVEVKESDLQTLKGREAINLRGEIIGVSRLSTLLSMELQPSLEDRVLSVVLLQAGNRKIGIVVDDLSNQQEIVVKPLQKYLSNIAGISGSTILGNGEIILILDPAELIELAGQ